MVLLHETGVATSASAAHETSADAASETTGEHDELQAFVRQVNFWFFFVSHRKKQQRNIEGTYFLSVHWLSKDSDVINVQWLIANGLGPVWRGFNSVPRALYQQNH